MIMSKKNLWWSILVCILLARLCLDGSNGSLVFRWMGHARKLVFLPARRLGARPPKKIPSIPRESRLHIPVGIERTSEAARHPNTPCLPVGNRRKDRVEEVFALDFCTCPFNRPTRFVHPMIVSCSLLLKSQWIERCYASRNGFRRSKFWPIRSARPRWNAKTGGTDILGYWDDIHIIIWETK
jgi:hypothetical protein